MKKIKSVKLKNDYRTTVSYKPKGTEIKENDKGYWCINNIVQLSTDGVIENKTDLFEIEYEEPPKLEPRENKFRAWVYKSWLSSLQRYVENKMFYGVMIGKEVIYLDSEYDIVGYSECSRMQFTGRQDKTGKDIYEGDIVKVNSNTNYMVIYDNTHCKFYLKCGDFTHRFIDGVYYKVLGNIYENPELISN